MQLGRSRFDILGKLKKEKPEAVEGLSRPDENRKDVEREIAFRAFHHAPQLMAISNLETGAYVDINEAFVKTLGYPREELIGKTSDDIQVFTDLVQSSKYFRILSKFKKVTDFPVSLKLKNGETKPFLFSAETVKLENEFFLLTTYNEISSYTENEVRSRTAIILGEIFETVSSYLLLISYTPESKYIIRDINSRAEEIENVVRESVVNRCFSDSPLAQRVKLYEIINHIRITGEPHKLAASEKGDDSEGYYMGFLLSNNEIVITWEKSRERDQLAQELATHKKVEQQLIREKAFLEHLIDSTPEAIVITDIPGKITLINREFTNLFGYTNEEAIGKYIDDLVVPDDLKEEALNLDSGKNSSGKITLQTVRKDKYGNRINVSLIASNIVISDVTVALLGIYRDITADRKNQLIQEILYNISTTALKQFDIKDIYPSIVTELNKIWDTSNFYITLYDPETNKLSLPFFSDEKDDFNEIPAKGTITGWVINRNRSVLLREDDMKRMEEAGEIELVGTPCKVWLGVPLRIDNNIIGVMCLQDYYREDKFTQDDLNVLDFIANQIAIAIQRRSMLDNLISARQKAEEAAKSKQIFMSTMSHEIRTPLNEVIGIANLLMQSNPNENQLDLIKTLRFSANHLLTLVNDVLDFNKMELGKIVFEQTQFNLSDFLEEIKRTYSFRASEKKLEFNVVSDKKVPAEVIGDQIRLNQILSNLLSNALKFTQKGSIRVSIDEIERAGNHSTLEFRVADTGIGIPREKHSEIFESFTQASPDTTRLFGGTGLGLAICKRLVELQGGTINVESVPDKGSTFIFRLIFGVAARQGGARISGDAENYRGLEGKRILVAEDNKINFYVANKFLTGWGVIVSHAENGQLALEMIEKNEYDLILMDLHMPILDGIEASRIIRNSENQKIRDLPIVALTAAIMSESHDRIEGLNINDYVLKPFKPQDLYDRIRKHIK